MSFLSAASNTFEKKGIDSSASAEGRLLGSGCSIAHMTSTAAGGNPFVQRDRPEEFDAKACSRYLRSRRSRLSGVTAGLLAAEALASDAMRPTTCAGMELKSNGTERPSVGRPGSWWLRCRPGDCGTPPDEDIAGV